MKKFFSILIMVALPSIVWAGHLHRERDYRVPWCEYLGGRVEVSVGQLLKNLAAFLKKVGEEIGERTFEENITNAGYTDVSEAVADIPNHFTGQTAQVIRTNIVKTGETVSVLDASIDNTLPEQLLNIIINIKDKAAEVTPLTDRV